ncbi:SHOCT domain-containing protein [Rhodococcus sp. NPDC003318]|uniref:SHOCT domain-containing protein n=1 Tax=Rhodococcus sp. NPDC003318 TaxID=3364503 RepID=UPI0036B1E683
MLDSFWDFLWYTLLVFAFVAYLFILFQILTDLFRDHKVSGFVKVVWIIFLIVFPYLTAFVYLIVRGRGMTERTVEANARAKEAADAYIRDVAATTPADAIASAKALLDSGAITQAEYEQLKAKALA